MGHTSAVHTPCIAYSTDHRWTIINIKRGGGRSPLAATPHFLDIGYGPSVVRTVGCTWFTYSLCMAHIWPVYDLHMAHIAFRSAIRSAQRTDHQGTLGEKKGDLSPSLTVLIRLGRQQRLLIGWTPSSDE